MKVGDFEVTCTKCGSKNINISNYHNEYEEGVRFRCNGCKVKVEV